MDPAVVGKKLKQTYKNGIAKDGRPYSEIPDAEIGSMFILKNGDKGMQALGIDPKAQSTTAKQQETANAKADSLKKAQAVLDVVKQGRQGNLKGDTYNDALNSVVSGYTASQAFNQGGKNLTATELALLSGQNPRIEKTTGNIVEQLYNKAIGREVPQKSTVVDSPDQIERKMKIAVAALQGKPVPYDELNAVGQGAGNGKSVEQFAGNAGNDTKNILNSVLGIPGQAVNTIKTAATAQDPRQRMEAAKSLQPNEIVGNAFLNYIKSLNEDVGRPLEGGDILGRAGENLYNRPVGTALDVLPFLGGAASKLKGGSVTTPTKTAASAAAPNLLQKALGKVQETPRIMADAVNGSGSKEYVARQAVNKNTLPQNQVLLEEGIVGHPSQVGKIQATSKALNKYGTQIGDAYKNSDRVFKGDELSKALDDGLKGQGYDSKAIGFIKNYINQQGGFDLGSGDNVILAEKAWGSAKTLESNPPKMLKNPESSSAYKKLSADAAKIIRNKLGEKVPETKDLNARYSALRDYMDNSLPEVTTGAMDANNASLVKTPARGAQALTNLLAQGGYSGTKLIRDKRSKLGNVLFRQ